MDIEEAELLVINRLMKINRHKNTVRVLMLWDENISSSENARRIGIKKANCNAIQKRYKLKSNKYYPWRKSK